MPDVDTHAVFLHHLECSASCVNHALSTGSWRTATVDVGCSWPALAAMSWQWHPLTPHAAWRHGVLTGYVLRTIAAPPEPAPLAIPARLASFPRRVPPLTPRSA